MECYKCFEKHSSLLLLLAYLRLFNNAVSSSDYTVSNG